MSQPLDGSWAKLERAKAYVDTLRDEIAETTGGELQAIPLHRSYETEQGAVVYRVESIPEIRDTWGLLIGDALHNLRCALDHLWWQVAVKHLGRDPTEDEAKEIQFPIFSKPAFLTDPSRWKNHPYLRHVDPAHAAKDELLQPYHGMPPGELHPLEALATLSNIDKHRVLHTVFRPAYQAVVQVPSPEHYRDCVPTSDPGLIVLSGLGVLQAGDEVVRIEVTPAGPDPDVDLRANLTANISIHDNWNPVDTLDGIGAQIALILEAFEPLL